MGLLQVFHEDGHHDIDQDKLGEQDEDNKEQRSEILLIRDIEIFIEIIETTDLVNTTVLQAVLRVITLISQSVFHDSIPVIPWQGLTLNIIWNRWSVVPVAILKRVRKAIPNVLK